MKKTIFITALFLFANQSFGAGSKEKRPLRELAQKLVQSKVNLNKNVKDGLTAAQWATRESKRRIRKGALYALLEAKANPDATSERYPETALQTAIKERMENSIVAQLLSAKADLSVKDPVSKRGILKLSLKAIEEAQEEASKTQALKNHIRLCESVRQEVEARTVPNTSKEELLRRIEKEREQYLRELQAFEQGSRAML